MNITKTPLYIALLAVATMPAMASEPAQLPAQPIVAEAPKAVAPTEVLPTGEVKKEEEKKLEGEIKAEVKTPGDDKGMIEGHTIVK